ncbi:MAG: copper resistance protein CopC, partial [Kineosporiaceae bacterium]
MDRSVPRKACRRLLLGLAPLTLGVLLIAGAAVAPPASAATEPVNTQPSAGSVLDSAPSRVRLTFAQSIMPGSLIEVHGPRGLADNGAERISNRTIIQPLASDLPAGMYTVAWQVVLRDGEQSFSRYTFTVQAEHTQDPRPTRKTPTTPPQKTPTTPEHRESSSPASAAPSPRGTVPTADTSADAAADAAALPAANSAFGGGKSTGDIVLGVFSLVAAAALIVGLAYGWHAGWWQNGLPLTGGA